MPIEPFDFKTAKEEASSSACRQLGGELASAADAIAQKAAHAAARIPMDDEHYLELYFHLTSQRLREVADFLDQQHAKSKDYQV